MMKAWIGKSVLVIGFIHTVFGFVVFRNVISQLAGELFINTLGTQPERHSAFWFLMTGFSLLIVGGLIDWIERRNLELPLFLKWGFLALTIVGCCIVPKSGFWLLVIPLIGMYVRAHKKADKQEPPAL